LTWTTRPWSQARRSGNGAEHVVGHVAGCVAEGAGGGVGGDDRGAADVEGAVEGAVGDVGDVDHHAQAVHLVDHVLAEFGKAVLGVGTALSSRRRSCRPSCWSWTR